VEKACAADVEKLCKEPEELSPLYTNTLGDPFLDWVFLPMAPPPMMVSEMNDISFLMDRMMDSAMRMPVDSFIIFESQRPSIPAAEHAMDSVVIRLAESKPQEIPQLTEQIAHYGQHILQQPQLAERHHLARRLTEVNANDIQNQVHLPFGCSKNRCLREIFATKASLSEECLVAMTQLDAVNKLEIHLEQQQDLFAGMVWVYIGLISMLLILLARRYRGAKVNRRLRIRILQTIYSNPVLKAQVERELGESLGNVPPLPTHVLRMMSAGGTQLKSKIFCLRRVRLIFFVFLLALVFVAPFWVLPICIMVAAVRVGLVCCGRKPLRECTCCCCGVSTEDVKNGLVSAAQACCDCCKGTGVCSPACASCCGKDGCCDGGCCDKKVILKDCCCCCGAMAADFDGILTDCCCCGGTGVPRGMVDGCCCCCGASAEDASTGNITKEQAGCCCCNGTGIPRCASNRSASCNSGGDCCALNKPSEVGRGRKHQFPASEGVYYGLPLQVV
jgi:hypothetical protein